MKPVKNSFTIHDLPVSERPRERLQRLGVGNISEQELLSVVLGRGIAGESVTVTTQRLLKEFGNLKGIAAASLEDLIKIKGIGLAKASQIQAVFELARREKEIPDSDGRLPVGKPEEVYNLVKGNLISKKKEYCLSLLLDTRCRLIRITEVSIGSLDSSIAHPREVFTQAVAASAASIIFVHNHPSGDPKPSEDDIKLTKRLIQSGEIMGIPVHDHIIIGNEGFYSLKREGFF